VALINRSYKIVATRTAILSFTKRS
jgi:hypothetical protein